MSSKSTPLSFRVSDEDAEFLAGLQLPGAVTPSEKLRVLVTRARMEHASQRTYESSLRRIRELLEPTHQALREHELTARQRSELIADTLYWLPDLVAYLMTGPADEAADEAGLKAFEAGLADRIFRFIEAVLRLGVTAKAPCYNPELISQSLAGTLELAQLIVSNRNKDRH
ncbi:MAG: hypothetical protein H7A20_11090 [Rhodanobacteraceae bacterium]|nr:hypothetical protein [Xanthomonadales bacterium]MCP5479302.1 hypothetical protein [Rhodanobacteraceae bacterium]HPF74572.1 hypothetical protein [Xanthomonadaceae bacterium]HRX98875.1 hypothetical protein [Xanthomonadaceae bacterium]